MDYPVTILPTSGDAWCIVGPGDSYRRYLPGVIDRRLRIFGCNQCFKLVLNPDICLLTDFRSMLRYRDEFRDAAASGTEIITRSCTPLGVGETYVDYDVRNKLAYSRDRIAHGRSGICIGTQILLSRGVTHIEYVGADGYWPGLDSVGGWDQDQCDEMNMTMALVMAQIFNDRDDCKFAWHGSSKIVELIKDLPGNVELREVDREEASMT